MSDTIVLDGAFRLNTPINYMNEVIRHCRIGRVTKKVMVHGGQMMPLHLMPGAQMQSNGALTSA